MKTSAFKTVLAVTIAAGLVSGCLYRENNRGSLPTEQRIKEVRVGEFTKADVQQALGSPSTTSNFGEDSWIYMGEQMRGFAFMRDSAVERKIVVVRFNDSGVVRDMQLVSLDDGRSVSISDKETPTAGRKLNAIEQIIENFGKFNTEEAVE